jgi:hypothetical protein
VIGGKRAKARFLYQAANSFVASRQRQPAIEIAG